MSKMLNLKEIMFLKYGGAGQDIMAAESRMSMTEDRMLPATDIGQVQNFVPALSDVPLTLDAPLPVDVPMIAGRDVPMITDVGTSNLPDVFDHKFVPKEKKGD